MNNDLITLSNNIEKLNQDNFFFYSLLRYFNFYKYYQQLH